MSAQKTLLKSKGKIVVNLILKILNIIMLLLSVAWLARNPDWEPVIVSFGFFISLITQEYQQFKLINHKNTDLELFSEFQKDFPSNGTCTNFLKEHDLGASFNYDDLAQLREFIYNWNDAEHEFCNIKLNKQKEKLFNLGDNFIRELSLHVHSKGHNRFDIGMHDFETRSEMMEIKEKLNSMATEVYQAHQDLIRMCKRVL